MSAQRGLERLGTGLMGVGVAMVSSSCGLFPFVDRAVPDEPPHRMPPLRYRVAQLGFGDRAAFSVCVDARCPVPTVKTLDEVSVSGVAPSRPTEGAAAPAVTAKLWAVWFKP